MNEPRQSIKSNYWLVIVAGMAILAIDAAWAAIRGVFRWGKP